MDRADDQTRDQSDPVADLAAASSTVVEPSDSKSLAEFNLARVRDTYGFCTKDFRAETFAWEPLDMLRKLALSGLLQFFGRGTAFQVLCGCILSFGSCITQVWVWPYVEPEANILKAMVEMQIFATFLISFILRV